MIVRSLPVVLAVILLSCGEKGESFETYKAPVFSLLDADSVSRSLGEYRSQLVMLHFWADWCPHCRGEFSEMEKAYQILKAKGFEIIAINSGQSMDHVREIRDTYGVTFPMLVDESKELTEVYAVKGLPVSFFLNEQRNVIKTEHGWLTESKVIEIYNQLN